METKIVELIASDDLPLQITSIINEAVQDNKPVQIFISSDLFEKLKSSNNTDHMSRTAFISTIKTTYYEENLDLFREESGKREQIAYLTLLNNSIFYNQVVFWKSTMIDNNECDYISSISGFDQILFIDLKKD